MGKYRQTFSITAAALVGALSLGSAAHAELIYGTTFDTTGPAAFDSDFALSQQNGWATNDPFVAATGAGQVDAVTLIEGYSGPGSTTNLWASVGGLIPSRTPGFTPGSFSISVWKPFSSAGLLTGGLNADAIRLDVDFAITSSGAARPKDDSFSWAFRDSAGTTIFRLALDPVSVNLADGLALTWYNGAGQATATPNTLSYDSIYKMQVDVNMSNLARDAFTLRITDGFGTTSTILNDVTLPEGAATSLAQIGPRWDILDPAADVNGDPAEYGQNALVFNNYSISTVPEPGSALLLAVGATLGLGWRRRG